MTEKGHLSSSSLFIVTGKGGVGKTSIAAAHALASAREGKRTLLVSADMAHNIGDVFGIEAGGRMVCARDCLHAGGGGEDFARNLFFLELDPYLLMRREYPHVNKAIAALAGSTAGAAIDQAGDSYMIPGFENLFCLLKIRDLYRQGRPGPDERAAGGKRGGAAYRGAVDGPMDDPNADGRGDGAGRDGDGVAFDRIIVDCAPTGETLSLLKLPELLAWYVEKFSPVGRMLTRALTPLARIRYQMDLPDGKAMDELGSLFRDLVDLQDLLKDPDICRVRLVTIPERMVVEETRRSYMYLNLYGYAVDAVFINRVLPPDTGSAFMGRWQQIQSGYVEELGWVFTEIPAVKIPWYSAEIRGVGAVSRLADELEAGLGEAISPGKGREEGKTGIFALPAPAGGETYEAIEGGYLLTVHIPGGQDEDVQVLATGTDLDVAIRNFRRSIPLPGVLRGAKVASVNVREGKLLVVFHLTEKRILSDGKRMFSDGKAHIIGWKTHVF